MRAGGRSALGAAVTLGVLGLLTAAFLAGFRRESKQVFAGPGPEAMGNDFLAAALLLERLGLTVSPLEGPSGLSPLPDPPGTVIVPVSRRVFPTELSRELLDWVERGGSLVVLAADPQEDAAQEDPLLAPFGVQARPVSGTQEEWAGPCPKLLRIELPDSEREGQPQALAVGLDIGVSLVDGGGKAFLRTPPNRPRLLRLAHGRGVITVLAGGRFMANDCIGAGDNAALLWFLAGGPAAGGRVLLVYGEEYPPLTALILRHGWPLLASLAALIAALIGFAAPRLAPPAAPQEPPRRGLLEHLDASGRFLWRHGQAGALVEGMRRTLWKTLLRRHPSWTRLGAAGQTERLAELCGLSGRELEELKIAAGREGAVALRDEKRFIRTVAALERIRSSL